MTSFRFLHTADWHIGSPLRGLEQYPGAPVERIRRATCEAVERLVEIACERQVRFIVIAGDVFDGKWPDVRVGLWLNEQFRRLGDQGIEVYLVRGNHDAANRVPQRMSWPNNVREFSVDEAERVDLPDLPVSITGRGFALRDTSDDLTMDYPPRVTGRFTIGVLHTSLTGRPDHDTYAPTSLERLRQLEYDYWALGHVHAYEQVATEPYVVFSGTPQGRHIKETGPKGCVIVDVDEQQVSRMEFVETDVVRWSQLIVNAQPSDDLDAVLDLGVKQLESLRQENPDRLLAVRVVVQGACAAHERLVAPDGQEDATLEFRNRIAQWGDVWIERVDFQTSPAFDIEQLRERTDLLGDLLTQFATVQSSPDALAELASCFDELCGPHSRKLRDAGIQMEQAEQLRRWTRQAEMLVASLLCEDR